jgi:hypothetical protein
VKNLLPPSIFSLLFCTFALKLQRYTMTEFKDLVQLRRSHRKFSEQEVDADDLKLILRAALMAPTSKSQRAWQFVVVEDKLDMEKCVGTPQAETFGGKEVSWRSWRWFP